MKKENEHIERVITERDELGEKLKALKEFLSSDAFIQYVDKPNQILLEFQYKQMAIYLEILNKRILLAG